MAQFRVFIPPNVKSGQTIRVRCPDGSQGDVVVPKGLKSGDTFVLDMDKTTNFSVKYRLLGLINVQEKGDMLFFDWHELILACSGGLFILASVVFGFLLGVLYITAELVDVAGEERGEGHAPKLRPYLIGDELLNPEL